MLQYYFDGPEMEIKIKPHGNSKSDVPFFRISESAQKFHKELSIMNKPKEVIFLATQKEGGEVEARGMSSLPRNRQQISNFRRDSFNKCMQYFGLCLCVSTPICDSSTSYHVIFKSTHNNYLYTSTIEHFQYANTTS